MTGVTTVSGHAALLCQDNVDTDQICPARFMKRRRFEGYGDAFLHDLRFHEDGTARANPIEDAQRGGTPAPILLAGRNFGGGSSREAAVYATLDAGFRAVVATSFGDIFAANAARNGLIAAQLEEADFAALLDAVRDGPDDVLSLDLDATTITCGALTVPFAIDATRRKMLLNGWDDADITRTFADEITAFTRRDRRERPWAQTVEER